MKERDDIKEYLAECDRDGDEVWATAFVGAVLHEALDRDINSDMSDLTVLLKEKIAAARLDAGRRMRAYCLDWIRAHARDCGCSDRIEQSIDGTASNDAALARIVGGDEPRVCPLCHKSMEVVSTSGCCMDCYNKNTGPMKVMQEGWEKGE